MTSSPSNLTAQVTNSFHLGPQCLKHKQFFLNAFCQWLMWYGNEALKKLRVSERPESGKLTTSL